ncbi:hypothetical protein [Mesorhizobium sp.]|uniref:hypothetical protein n=1 Tax=Mesorhizobium sp. TaxID=1871066 RepID=UPI000FE2D7E2|nr:hypothetical protein [Mesorhizobium sp.]RWH72877.1 MAG: hypothetical protein EOQ84_11715 [Mesorhizobium sp.]RWL34237.1 MAG: hypothetical protein EOR58_00290 [Mesorhizobium sp.]RWL35653.1 MAG: hypothetical protein EOR63_02870 [Mesorhizobium sp.]RWL41063.1 MAG: hypothetical protein EOR59_00295 [Mesorhizobium sp.]RWL52171.1 MAG: hypothetical protein EOR62_18750 [Mesorhizobium sp.]
MTRHGIILSHVVGAQPPAPDPRLSVVIINADRAVASRVTGRQHRLQAHRSGLSVSISALLGDVSAIADISRKSKSP